MEGRQEAIDGMVSVEVNGSLNYTKDRRREEKETGWIYVEKMDHGNIRV